MRKILFGFVSLLVLGLVAFGTWYLLNSNKIISYLTISINPEVELMLNEDDKVIDYLALNEDADILMSGLEVKGLSVEEASDLIIESAMELGYINEFSVENAIIVKTMNESEEDRLKLETKVMEHLQAKLEEKKVYAVMAAVKLGDALKEEAETYGISNGKMLLVEEAIALNDTLVKEELVEMTIQEIQSLIKDVVKSRHDEVSDKADELKTIWQEKKDELKETYKNEVDALKNEFKEEIENYNDLTEEEKSNKIKEVIAEKKNALKEELEELKEEVQNYLEDGNYNSVKDEVIENIRSAIKNRGN